MAVDNPSPPFKNPSSCCTGFGRIFMAEGSTVYYSQVLITEKDAGRCYQNNDPTSEEIPDLLDTDGGLLKIDEAVNIKTLKRFQAGILVFATNGVWYVYNPDGGFKATAYSVSKVSERGLASLGSIVEIDNAVLYFSNNAITLIKASEFEVLQEEDISSTKIRQFFLEYLAGRDVIGVYNTLEKRVEWWVKGKNKTGLFLDVDLMAFYPQRNASVEWSLDATFKVDNALFYLASKPEAGLTYYAPNQYLDETFKDFGADITAYMISGWETLGKFGNRKNVTQAKAYFRKTESTILGYEDGNYVYDKPSSCLFQARWDFDSTDAGNRFMGRTGATGKGKEMQLYKPLQRGFIPDEYPYTFDTGESVISKKFNIRGSGDGVQFVFKAEPEKDLKLLGYSVSYTMRGRM